MGHRAESLKHMAVVQIPRILPRMVKLRKPTVARTTCAWII